MSDFKIITDATCDLTTDYYASNDVTCISMTYRINNIDYRFGNDEPSPSIPEFYKSMQSGSLPKTAQITGFEISEVFSPILENGYDVLYLAFSSALSGSCTNAMQEAEDLRKKFPDRKILIIDTLAASLGEGLFVDYAVEYKKQDKTIEETYVYLESIKQNLCSYFTVDDLHHLHKGGRVSKVKAIVGTLLNIKPILHVNDKGQLVPIGKSRGRKAALDMLIEKMKLKIGYRLPQRVFISHGDCLQDAEYVAKQIEKVFNITDIKIGYIGQVIGAHSGPGTVALFFMGENRTEKK